MSTPPLSSSSTSTPSTRANCRTSSRHERACRWPRCPAASALEPRRVYVIPPNRQLLVTDQHLALAEFDEPRWQRAPIDLFFRSLAAQRGDDFAIVLSGAGSDGSIGIKAVKEAGGIILVQDPDEAEYGSMPRSAIATGLADFVLPVREIAGRLPELIRNRARTRQSDVLE